MGCYASTSSLCSEPQQDPKSFVHLADLLFLSSYTGMQKLFLNSVQTHIA